MGLGKRKFVEFDGYRFDNEEEKKFYIALKENRLGDLIGEKEANNWKLLEARPSSIGLIKGNRFGDFLVRDLKYTPDFIVDIDNGQPTLIEIKSSRTEQQPDYRLRRKLLLLSIPKLRFVEITYIKKGEYKIKKSFSKTVFDYSEFNS